MLTEVSFGNLPSIFKENPLFILLFVLPGQAPSQSAIVEAEKFNQQAAGVPLFVVNFKHYPEIALNFGIVKFPSYLGWRNSKLVKRYYIAANVEELNKFASELQVGDSEVN